MILKYQSGEEIRKGDRVLFHLGPAEIEFVATDPNDPELSWYVEEYGGGVMVREPNDSNPTFISADQIPGYADLEFVSRTDQK